MDKFEEQADAADLEELEHEFDQVSTFCITMRSTTTILVGKRHFRFPPIFRSTKLGPP